MAVYNLALPGGRNFTLRLTVNESSQDIADNQSIVSWSLQIIRDNFQSYSYNSSTWSVNIGGVVRSGSISGFDFRNYSTLTLGSGTVTINHNADGTKSINSSGTFTESVSLIGSGTVSGGPLALTTIPRASNSTFVSAIDAGDAFTITTNRASTSFTHTLRYAIGSASGVIATGVGASFSWTPPLSLLNQITTATSRTMTITTETYSGATLIGTTTRNITLRVPTEIVPTIADITISEFVTAVATEVGAFVKGLSRLTLGISGEAGEYGSTIVTRKITVAGQTINADSGTTAVLGQSGTLAVVATVTDSRGRVGTRSENITVLDYTSPTIAAGSPLARRATAGGVVAQESGTSIRVDLNATVASLINSTQRNLLTYRVSTRLRGDTTWTVRTTSALAAGTIAYNSNFVIAGTYAIDDAWEVRVEVYDKFQTTTVVLTVPTATIYMHWATLGVAINKYHEQGALDVGGSIYQNNNLVVDVSRAASTTQQGIVELATTTEATTGTDTTRAVTAAGVEAWGNGRTTTTSQTGLIELATQAEVNAGTDTTRAVTPATLLGHPGVPFAMAAGLAGSVTIASGDVSDVTVTFPSGRFDVAPRVIVEFLGDARDITTGALSITATNFILRRGSISTVSRSGQANWIAVQMTSAAASG